MMKTRQDNNVIDSMSVVYAKIETEPSGPIERGLICY